KTGTLTEGKPAVATILPTGELTFAEVLWMAASLEQGSGHPLAAGIVRSAKEQNLPLPASHDVRAIAGKGVTGIVEGHTVTLGNLKLLEDLKIAAATFRDQAETLRNEGQTVSFLVVDG